MALVSYIRKSHAVILHMASENTSNLIQHGRVANYIACDVSFISSNLKFLGAR